MCKRVAGWLFIGKIVIFTTIVLVANPYYKTVLGQQKDGWAVKQAEIEKQYPIAKYVVSQPEQNTDERKRRIAKSKRYEGKGLVVGKPSPNSYSSDMFFDRFVAAMPTDESSAVVVGTVISAYAYLSEDKTGVYSEFQIRISEVIKGKGIEVNGIAGCDRLGGFVQYPDGAKMLYRVMGLGMPLEGKNYILFLTQPDSSPNYKILTGYQISDGTLLPLNNDAPIKKNLGADASLFLQELRRSILINK
jgi:hypothetical protein